MLKHELISFLFRPLCICLYSPLRVWNILFIILSCYLCLFVGLYGSVALFVRLFHAWLDCFTLPNLGTGWRFALSVLLVAMCGLLVSPDMIHIGKICSNGSLSVYIAVCLGYSYMIIHKITKYVSWGHSNPPYVCVQLVCYFYHW